MPRELPLAHRRLAEEAVRSGMAAAVVMEAAAREWIALEGEESFPEYLVRREVLGREQVDGLATAVASESGEVPETGGAAAPGEAGPARAFHPSEVIKGYRILERLGRGGMGSVYRADQVGMNRVVALKILRRPFGQVEEHVERLRREARLVGALDHPNIVRGLDVGQHGPYHYFAMEFVEGETLRDLLKRRGIVPESEALRLVEQVCLALDHAHSRGIVHRDVKPGNIIVTPDGTPKLTDYGLAKGPADFTLTQSGVTIGTPQYISPEQAKDPVGVGIQTDLYSLGATAYHMLTGIPPHTSDTLAGLLTKVLYEKPRTARQVNPKVSAGASFLVEKMMAKQPRHRYREPREVLRDLRSLASGKSIVPSNWAGDFEVQEARQRVRLIGAAAAAAVVLLVAATVWLQWRNQAQERKNREDGAAGRYALIDDKPRSQEDWVRRLLALEEFLRDRANAETRAFGVATDAQKEAQGNVDAWRRATNIRSEAARPEQALRFREATGYAREELRLFEREVEKRFGLEPAKWLREEIEGIREAGRRETRREIDAALERAAKAPAVEGIAGTIADELGAAMVRFRDEFLDEGDSRPLQEIDNLVTDLRRARTFVEDAKFGPGFRETADRLLAEADFVDLEEMIAGRVESIAQDAALRDLLERIPRPAAADLRERGAREMARALARNEKWLEESFAAADALAAAGKYDRAVELLEGAESQSMTALRARVTARRKEVVARRDESARASEILVRAFLGSVFDCVVRRDFALARKLAAEATAAAPAAERPAIGAASLSALKALGLVDALCFERIRRRVAEKGDLPELQFVGGGKVLQRYREVANLRLVERDTGWLLVFDEPGQPGLKGELYRLTLPLLFTYAELDAAGPSNEQCFVRALLVVLAADGEKVERRDLEAAAGQLRRVVDLVEEIRPVVEFLLARAEAQIDARIKADDRLEEEAEKAFKAIGEALDARAPLDAIYKLNRLSGPTLRATQFVADHRNDIRLYAAQAQAMMDDLRIEARFPGARVEVLRADPKAEPRTRITLDFDSDRQFLCFVPLEGAPHRIVQDAPVDGNGGPRNGRLAFLEGGANRALPDSPLSMECIFRTSRYMAMQFRLHTDSPLLWQFSLAGNHVCVLTDDGRKTSGRGVLAWQKEDWKEPDGNFPDLHRHDFLPKTPELLKKRTEEGERFFQFEKGEYLVRIEWDHSRLKLLVDGKEIWNARLRSDAFHDNPPRFRILTYTGGWIDDLSVEGVVDKQVLDRLLKSK